MAGKVLKMNNMSKINNSAIMNKSAGNPATTHTHNRWQPCKPDAHLSPFRFCLPQGQAEKAKRA